MDLYVKKFVIFYLISVLAGIFILHWFFVAGTMSASECFSIDCIYSAPQAVPTEPRNILLLVLLAALFVFLPLLLLWFDDKFKKMPGGLNVLGELRSVFDYKLNSWLKILEKRDPSRIFYGAKF